MRPVPLQSNSSPWDASCGGSSRVLGDCLVQDLQRLPLGFEKSIAVLPERVNGGRERRRAM